MTNRHIRIAMQLQEKALAALTALNPEDIPAKELLSFLAKATQLERMNRLDEAGLNEAKETQIEDDGFMEALNEVAGGMEGYESDVPVDANP